LPFVPGNSPKAGGHAASNASTAPTIAPLSPHLAMPYESSRVLADER
jgi:hypothetical protein